MENVTASNELVKSVCIDTLLGQRASVEKALGEISANAASISQLMAMLNQGARKVIDHQGAGDLLCKHGYGQAFSLKDAEAEQAAMKRFDSLGWQYLMRESGLRSLMDADAKNEWDKQIEARNIPPLTRANIESTFASLYNSRTQLFERGVVACFHKLSWCYKTNLPQKFGLKIVMKDMAGTYGHRVCEELDDLLRVFHIVDGKPEPDSRSGIYVKLMNEGFGHSRKTGVLDCEYVSIKIFKNNNGHVTFKRHDLVDGLNRVIARHFPNALPEPKSSP